MKKRIITLVLLGAMLLGGGIFMVTGHKELSLSERRTLAQWPKLTWQNISSGKFMSSAEDAAADQFPMRDTFRTMKAYYLRYGQHQLDNNGIYVMNGNAAKLEYPLQTTSVQHAVALMDKVYKRYLLGKPVKCYYSVVPDKNYYLAAQLGYPSMDYDALLEKLDASLRMTYIDLFDQLDENSYYNSDPHWRQEALIPVANTLTQAMGVPSPEITQTLDAGEFSGAYAGQSALPLAEDRLRYLEIASQDSCSVLDVANNVQIPMYNLDKVGSRDPYDFFLNGASPIEIITNPNAKSNKELVIFRDSFGSSITPLLADSYAKITLVDLRYTYSDVLSNYITFTNQDVLFLYSTTILNNSQTLH